MKEIVIDTNVFIYAVLEDSEFHDESRKFLSSLQKWVVPSIVIYELYWFFRDRNFEKDEIESVIRSIIDSRRCMIVGDNGKFTKRAVELTDKPGRFNDMVILAVAEKYGVLATYDRRLRKEAESLGLLVYPTE